MQQNNTLRNILILVGGCCGTGCMGFIVIMIIGAVAGSHIDTNSNTSNEPHRAAAGNKAVSKQEPQEAAKPDLEVLNTDSSNDGFMKYATGTVRNNTDHAYNYVQVEINTYDKQGNQLGSTLANCNNLEPGGKWKFKAVVADDNAAKFKIKDVTGF